MLRNIPDAPTRTVLAQLPNDLAVFSAAPDVDARRSALRLLATKYGPDPAAVARIVDVIAPAPEGDIPIRLYIQQNAERGHSVPLVVHFHGGGWALGDAEAYERICRAYCAAGRCVVADVQYRRAPEHRFPAALDDCMAALFWLAEQAPALGADAKRIVVTGDSAGGSLAAAVCRRTSIPVALQILVYPMTTVSTMADYPSRRRFGKGEFFLTQFDINRARAEYCRAPVDAESPDVSPLLATDLSRVPPALIITAGLDPLRDEGAAYARQLREAGVAVTYRCTPRTIHGFVLFAGAIPKGRRVLVHIGRAIQAVKPR